MAEESESTVTTGGASLMKKISDKLHRHDSSSSNFDTEKPVASSIMDKVFSLSGREKTVHSVSGAGKRYCCLWILSIVGNWCNFLTLLYITFVLLHTVVLYEKYEAKIDPFAEKTVIEFKKQYGILDAKASSKITTDPLKGKKLD